MSLRQREWAIFIRPYDAKGIGGNTIRVPYTGAPKAMEKADLGYQYDGDDKPRTLKGAKEGEVDGLTCDDGGWVMYSKTSSFVELREILKELLDVYGANYTRVTEIIPLDTLVTPLT